MIEKSRTITEESSKHKQQTFLVMIILFILFSILLNGFQKNLGDRNDPLLERNSIPPLKDKPKNDLPKFPLNPPSLAIQPFQIPKIKILFIVGDENIPDPDWDQPFYNNITTLGFSITYHDANNSYDYSLYDAIIISDSIDSVAIPGSVDSLANASIPILTMEPNTWNLFNLGNGGGKSTIDNKLMDVVDNSSFITNHLPLGPLNISTNPNADKGYITGFNTITPGSNVIGLILPTYSNPPEKFYRSLVVIDKGEKDWVLNLTAERRVFLGTSNGSSLNQEGWKLWNKTLKWILYDDDEGNATINVTTVDLNENPVFNANVTLVNSSNPSNFTTHFTNQNGMTTFSTNYGTYDIIAKHDQSSNSTFISQEIAGTRTYHREAFFNYVITLPFSLDTTPPVVENITFQNISGTYTFFADLFDVDPIDTVFLNITVYNRSNYLEPYISLKNFTMKPQSVNPGESGTYYNDTALESLNHTDVEVFYNFIANDAVGYVTVTTTRSLILEDTDFPIIHEYNVTDYGDGTLEFYANITDESGIQDVLLCINGTLEQMHINESGLWIYRTQSFYGDLLNYTIFSANDTIGNENGSKIPSFPMDVGYITVSDSIPPQIDWVTPYITHDQGFIEWNVRIHETTIYQSDLDFNSVNISISVNSEPNNTQPMYDLEVGYFYYYGTFRFNDIVEFWINASDLADNFKIEYGIMEINDTASPQVTFNAIEFGNGTVEFIATVVDWPSNITTVFIHENSTGSWLKYGLNQIDTNFYVGIYGNFTYINRDLFYYAEAIDEAGNNNTLQLKLLSLTDIVPPDINLVIENSPVIDGQITIKSLAIDRWGSSQYVTNPFYANITYQDVTTTHLMEQEIIYYVSTHAFKFSDQITITVWTYDDAGNQGVTTQLITVDDLAPPNIKNFGNITFQNGTVIIWAEVVEGVNGSGLADDNSSVTIDYIYKTYQHAIMTWNGSGNFYSFSISGFTPGEAFTYYINAIDINENINITDWKPVEISDLTPPVYNVFGYSEQFVNHTATELSFWVEADDPFGTLGGVNITLDYFDGYLWFNWTDDMISNGSHYIYSKQLICNNTFSYSLTIYDETLNINKTPILRYKTLNFQPTTAIGHGVEFDHLELNPGEVRFWIKINDTFEEHTFQDHDVKLSVIDDTLGKEILTEKLMESNGTHHIYDLSIDYLHHFSYVMQVNDDGVLGGYYDPRDYSNSSQMLDYWKPIIHSSGIDQINETTILIWANVSDWGSEDTEVLLKYEFVSYEGNGGVGAQVTTKKMEFNGSLYIAELTFSETGTLTWFIEAYDIRDSSISSQDEYTFLSQPKQPGLFGLTLLQIILIIIVTALVLTIILFGGRAFQRKRSVTFYKTQEIKDKLAIIPNVYTILVSTEVGIPILTVTNILYQKDESLDDALSGLSVGIDTFLQSFQSDFMQQVQQQSSEYSTEMGKDENIRMSVIEQHRIQIMIVASQNYRIFVFLKEKPSTFVREAFYNAIEDIEKNIIIPNLGIVDETLFSPQIEAILRKNFPMTLLMPFIIDIAKLTKFDEELKRGLRPVPISRAGINALKRLVVTQTISKIRTKNPQAEIKLFDDVINKGLLKDIRKILYSDARKIMSNLLKIPNEQIHEALWTGSSPDVNIIIPHEDRNL